MNHAFWIAAFSVALYVLANIIIGTPLTRDILAAVAVFLAMANSLQILPHAFLAFRKGGMKDNWQLLMGNVLFWAGFGARETWLWVIRSEGRPQWMLDSPLNGFFVLWIVGAGLLCYSAASRVPEVVPQHKVYYTVIAGLSGVLLGIFIARVFMA